MRRARIAALVVLAGALLPAPAAYAQGDAPARFEAGIGVLWIGAQPLGTATASETTSAGGKQTLFTASSELAAKAGLAGHVGVRLTRALTVEAEGSYVQPPLRIALSGDSEGAAPLTASETIQQFTIGAGVVWHVPVARSARFEPFATAGGGYLRQLHERATLVETGRYYHLGGGASFLVVSGKHLRTKGIGARIDVRAIVRSKGVAFDGGSTTSPAAGVSAFVRF